MGPGRPARVLGAADGQAVIAPRVLKAALVHTASAGRAGFCRLSVQGGCRPTSPAARPLTLAAVPGQTVGAKRGAQSALMLRSTGPTDAGGRHWWGQGPGDS